MKISMTFRPILPPPLGVRTSEGTVRLLLDTHVLLWWLADDPSLPAAARGAIADEPEVFVSAASAWEIAIKRALGKLDAPDDLEGAVGASGFLQLPVKFDHAATAGVLPRHHEDPFDRMLVAQARCESLTLVTADKRLSRYPISVLQA
jgi:PIN domain nuclease of toxin-antitoxin system